MTPGILNRSSTKSWGPRLAIACFMVVAVVTGPGLPTAAAGPVAGKVVMGTAAVELPADLSISIVELSASGTEVVRNDVKAERDGTFTFEGNPTRRYLIGTTFRGVTYSTLVEENSRAAPELKIFEATQDPSVISIKSDTTTVLRGEEDTFEVLHLLLIDNQSDRTFVGASGGPGQPVISIPVPEGSFDYSVADQANPMGISINPRGMTVAAPVLPGETPLPYVFKVRVPRTGWQLRREVNYPTERADLLLGQGLTLKAGPSFDLEEQVTLEGRRYTRYRSGPLTPGSVVGADIGFPEAAGGSLQWGLATAIAALASVFFATSLIRRRRRKGLPDAPADDRNTLIEKIATLDNRFEAGLVPEGDYRSQREEMLGRLRVIGKPDGPPPMPN